MARVCPGSFSEGLRGAPASPARLGSSRRPRATIPFARARQRSYGYAAALATKTPQAFLTLRV
eukprot:2221556-Alexandrium_andersonii.AAC.1